MMKSLKVELHHLNDVRKIVTEKTINEYGLQNQNRKKITDTYQ